MDAIARDNSFIMQLLSAPIETANERWIAICDKDMLRFTLLSNPFVYLSCIFIIASLASLVSYLIGKQLKLQSSWRSNQWKSKFIQSTDNNGNVQVLSSASSPITRVNSSLTRNSSITRPSAADARPAGTSTDHSCLNTWSSRHCDSTFPMSPSSTDSKPFLLILNGFFFGIFGVGIPIVYVCTQSGYDMFSCDATPDIDDIKTKAVKHLGMVYLIIMLSDFLYPLSCLLRLPYIESTSPLANGSNKSYWSVNMQLLHVSIWLLLQLFEIVQYPAGFSIFTGFMVMIHRTYLYGYLVMTTASDQVSPKCLRSKWRTGLLWTQFLTNLAICMHHVYFSSFTPKTCGSKSVLKSTALYCAVTCIIMARNLIPNQSRHKHKST